MGRGRRFLMRMSRSSGAGVTLKFSSALRAPPHCCTQVVAAMIADAWDFTPPPATQPEEPWDSGQRQHERYEPVRAHIYLNLVGEHAQVFDLPVVESRDAIGSTLGLGIEEA